VNKQSINGLKSNYILAKCTASYRLGIERDMTYVHRVQGADYFNEKHILNFQILYLYSDTFYIKYFLFRTNIKIWFLYRTLYSIRHF